ncbi:MAG: GNAT family N-acetyltransferase [Actinobacteria bacterium]|nr:GNAT family N-acetyltransferase [Actinomycetota bacterium]
MTAAVTDEIRTGRLTLRPILAEDLDAYAAMYADPEVVRFIRDRTSSREETADWLARTIRRNELEGWDMRTILFRGTETVIGRCGIAIHVVEERIEHEVAYLLSRAHWGRGYATEASTAMRDHALGPLGLRRLIALIDHGNDASKRVADKLGMSYERDVGFRGRVVGMHALEA